jgi:glycosyltransferase involved in cell wall biosynthesis
MRFLMLNWRDPKNPASGGAERVSLAYLIALVERGHQVYWFANDFPGATREEIIQGIKIVRGGGRGASVLKAIQWYWKQKHFDLVIDQHHGIPWFAPWWAKTNCVAYIHEVLGPIWSAFYPPPLNAIGQQQERWTHWLYRNVPFWVPSESTKNDLQSNGVRNVTVIPNGTDATPLIQLPEKPLMLPLRLVIVSRLAPNKRVEHAIRVVQLLNERGTSSHLTIVGGGELQERLKHLVQTLQLSKQITFTGQLAEHEKDFQLQQAHFLIHTSIREGWGLNVIEANAMGTPAAIYPVGGLVDSTVQGKTGIIAADENPNALASCLAVMVRTPEKYANLRIAAWERSKTFRWEQILPKACNWLEEQASKPKSIS